MPDLLQRANDFRAAFARRQAAETLELPGAFAVRDAEFALSLEHNQLIVDAPGVRPETLPALAARGLGADRPHQITVLDAALGERAAPVLADAGYTRDAEVVLARGTAGCAQPRGAARPVTLDELRDPLYRQQLEWSPDEELARQLAERRAARLRGAQEVVFLASRTPGGEIAAWTDLYLDRAAGLAQLEDLVTAAPHRGHGHGDVLLATGLALAAAAGIPDLFLVAHASDWPRQWYARRGFTELGGASGFLRQ